jgi:predicted nucleic acid-binding protein
LSLFVDTSVWSLALRRDRPPDVPELAALERALTEGELVTTTGLVYQELLQGFHGPRDQQAIVARFRALPFLSPDRHDHFEAAQLRNRARRRGVRVGTIDAILAQLCIRYELRLLTTDADFARIAEHEPLERWTPQQAGR